MKKMVMTVLAAVTSVSLAHGGIAIKNGEKIAFLGDSITQFGNVNDGGYVNLVMRGLATCGVKAEKIPAGVSGNKSNQMLARLQKDVLDKKPDWMTLSCGVNDVGHGKNGVELEPYKTNIVAILDRCAAAGVRVIVMTPSLFGSGRDWERNASNKKLEGYAAFLRETAAARKLPLADVNRRQKEFLAAPDCPRANLTMDGLHMNAYGNQTMALAVLEAMGLTQAELAKCKSDWDLKVKAMLPLGTHWGNWNDSWKQLTVDTWEMLDARAQEKGMKTLDYIYAKINDRAPDLDWRRWKHETATPKCAAGQPAGFHGRVAALERITAANAAGDESERTWRASAWRNERVNGQIVLWTKDPLEQVRVRVSALKGAKGEIPASAVSARFVRYTTASFLHGNEGGPRTVLTGDILDDAREVSMTTNSFRPVWLTVKVPADAAAGRYAGSVEAVAAGGAKLVFPVELEVLARRLPDPKDWKFFLDLWQHPWAVARYHGVTPFSKEHYALMRPLWEELAAAGQKTITTTITDLPWNHQNYDAYHSMVRHVKAKDGTFKRDFSLWDEYVDFCESCGLGPQIHCYTMATWGHIVYWEDEATGDTVKAALKPGTPEHAAFWGPFLTEFRDHVKAQGRLGRVYIALDERSREELYATAELIAKCGAGLKLEMAGNKKPSEFKGITIDNYCQYIQHITPDYLAEVHATRPSDRFTSTFYVCCGPARPNTFTDSPLAESTWCGLYAAAKGLDGFLRWAYANWARDPLVDSTFGNWRPGDTFLVYPGCRLSNRWEMLRDGIEECEKIRILRGEGKVSARLEKALGAIEWTTAKGKDDAAIAADVAEVKAAVEEASVAMESGREWEDQTKLHAGKEAPVAAFASFPTVEEAKGIRSELCSRRVCLDSETDWRFSYSTRPEDRPVGFQNPSYDVSGWDVVKVPCSWQAMGINRAGKPYGHPYYTNANWPFVAKFPANSNSWPRVRGLYKPADFTMKDDENPVGCYRRDFTVPADWTGDEVYLEFGAVDSFFYLWVNGRYVGFSKSSRDPARFNVTAFVKPGANTVALEVYRFSDASYLEAQDMLLMSGLTRSVWLFHTPKTHIRDVAFTTKPVRKGDYAGAWRLDVRTDVVGGTAEVKAHVFDAAGASVRGDGVLAVAGGSLVFDSPKLWSAECPNLYTLVLELVQGGRTLEAVGFQLGFREVEIRDAKNQNDRTFLLNGQPIKMRGANRHESSPMYGHYTPDELIELDVRQLKQANCNHVRNSHYPQPDYFYYLCNKYGIYVMDEANLESHGFFYGKESISHVESWKAAHVDRVVNMVERNKCHPCVVIWSMANEAGPGSNFVACVAAARKADPSRPVQYERNNWITDMGSRQYPTVDWVWTAARGGEGLHHEPSNMPLRYPFHINEYAHNMGNAMGNLKDYQDAIESSTRIMGSAIWDWVDQGIYKKVEVEVEGRGKEERTVLAYGGDWGEKPHCGSFMMNGCVLSDRTLEPGYWEIKHVFQPIVAEKDGNGIRVTNRHYFRDLSAYACVLTHLVDGEAVSEETLALTLGPRESKTVAVKDLTGSYRIAFRQKEAEGLWPKGWVIADDQIDFTAPAKASAEPSGNLTFGFCPKTGELVSLKCGSIFKTELLKEPLTLDVYRAPSQNEPTMKKLWTATRANAPEKRLVSFDDREENGVRRVASVVDYAVSDTVFRVATDWKIRDGAAEVKAKITVSGKPFEPAHLGFRTVFDSSSLKVDWLGCGPWENYSDRRSGAFLGNWSLDSKDFFVPYDIPQDCGNREGTYRVKLSSLLDSVTVETQGNPFAFEVNPYAPETLVKYAHPAELPESDSTFFGIWAKSRGLGGNSCGPLPLKRDIIPSGEGAVLEFVIR